MKSVVRKAILTGLGLVNAGSKAAEKLAKDLTKQAKLSEKEGEKVAQQLRDRSEKAIASLRKTVDHEVDRIVDLWNGTAGKSGKAKASKSASKRKSK